MKCCSRSTLGVIIGILNVLVYLAYIIYSIIVLINISSIEHPSNTQKDSISLNYKTLSVVLVLSILMVLISGLLIMGIVKRRHKLMMPWLILSGIGFILICGQFLFSFIGSIFQGYPLTTILITLVVGLLGIGFTALILWPIFTLFGDIRKENNEQPGGATSARQGDYQAANYYNKP